jgi:hypothetical protein
MGRLTDEAIYSLLNQISGSETILAFFTAICNRFEDTDSILKELALKRWLDSAGGVWLDNIGKIVGLPRPGNEIPASETFTYRLQTDPNDPAKGYSSLASPGTGGKYQTVAGVTDGTLVDDILYLQYIEAKILASIGQTTVLDIYRFIVNAFNVTAKISRAKAGFVDVELDSAIPSHERRMLVKYAPVGAGDTISILNWP